MYALILSLVPNWADADDIAQQVRLRLWEQFDDYDPDKDFGAWARTIAYYLILDYRKKASTRAQRFSQEFIDIVADRAVAAGGELDRRQAALAGCLGKLPDKRRQLLKRYYGEHESRPQIAVEMNCSFPALRKSLQRIRKTLMRCIEQTIQREGYSG
jgi:RNA polymerase sigma-70 factor (ECF subfamily)